MKRIIIFIRTLRKFKLRRTTARAFFVDDVTFVNLFYKDFHEAGYTEIGIYPIIFVHISNKRYLVYYTEKTGVAVFNM